MKLINGDLTSRTVAHRCRMESLTDENAMLRHEIASLEAKVAELQKFERIAKYHTFRSRLDRKTLVHALKNCYRSECQQLRLDVAVLQEELSYFRARPQPKAYAMGTASSRARRATRLSSETPTTTWSGQRSPISTPPSSAPDAPTPLPSYMKSTAASRSRAVVDIPEEPQPETLHVDEAAKAIDEDEWGYASEEQCVETRDQSTSSSEDDTTPQGEAPQLLSDAAWHHLLERRLGPKFTLTEWIDASWLKTPIAAVKLRSKFVKNLQTEALDLGAETWYAWGIIHTPDFMRTFAPEGHWDLLVDRATLIQRGVGMYDSGSLSGTYFLSHPSPHRVTHLVFNGLGRGLRNSTCHFDRSRTWPAQVYELVYPVLELAWALRDEPRARRAENILARLRREAEVTFDEIERRSIMAGLPGVQPWEPHHEELFEAINDSLQEYASVELGATSGMYISKERRWGQMPFGNAVVRAALEHGKYGSGSGTGWYLRSGWYGLNSPAPNCMLGYAYHTSWLHDVIGTGDSVQYTRERRHYWEQTARRRRPSVHGTDVPAMAWADEEPESRWKLRRDPRVTLNWLDLALCF